VLTRHILAIIIAVTIASYTSKYMTTTSQQTVPQKEENRRVVSSSQAQNQFGELVSWIVSNRGEVVIKRHGEPEIAMMPFDEYEETRALREQKRREEALDKLRALQKRVSARFQDLSQAEIEKIADQISRDALESLVKKGVVRFENNE
jgi:prevent-host-death family protein